MGLDGLTVTGFAHCVSEVSSLLDRWRSNQLLARVEMSPSPKKIVQFLLLIQIVGLYFNREKLVH